MSGKCGFYWLIEGQLAGSAYPSKCLEWMYHEKGIRAIISLEPLAFDTIEKAQSLGINVQTCSIPDFTAGTLEQRNNIIQCIDQFLAQELPTLVHCKGGLGRTGMILAIYLVKRRGLDPKLAIMQIRALREGSIEEGTQQREAVYSADEDMNG